jgi:hypothetical protein
MAGAKTVPDADVTLKIPIVAAAAIRRGILPHEQVKMVKMP